MDGAPVCTAASDQNSPTIISDGAGGAIVTWQDDRNGTNSDIHAQRVDAAGVPQWTADGVPLCAATGDQSRPTIVSDGTGGAIVAWKDSRTGTNWGIYAQRVDAAGVPQWTGDGVPLCSVANAQTIPRMVPDGTGGAIVTWDDLRGANWDIYAQRVDGTGAVRWAAEGVPLCTAPFHQKVPTIASDDMGGAIITWYDGRSSLTSWDIYAQRVDAAGTPQWTADGAPVCTAPNGQLSPAIVKDGAGGAIVTWDDQRSGTTNSNIFAQRVDASGVPQWTADGVPLCTAPFPQDHPTITSDGAGGAIVTWMDNRGGTNYDIYALHVLVSGAVDPNWITYGAPYGVAVCTAADDQFYPQIASDGAGGAIVTWYDYRTLDQHIYAQHVLATGAMNPTWTPNGVALCTAFGSQDFPTIVSDSAGGAIVTWNDARSYASQGWDIYAQRIYGSGAVASVLPPITAPFQLLALAPNPTRGGGLTVRFSLPASGMVSAQVLDLAGHQVRALAAEQSLPAGMQTLGWDGTSDAGARLPSGVYFVQLRVGGHSEARRVVLLH